MVDALLRLFQKTKYKGSSFLQAMLMIQYSLNK